nr:MAG TPA: hypothetical protein [Caudoviricetes sp.]
MESFAPQGPQASSIELTARNEVCQYRQPYRKKE